VPPEARVEHVAGWTVLAVAGELDIYTAPRLREQILDLINDGQCHLVLHMDGVTFIDSTGLGVLIGALKRLRAQRGEIRVVATVEPVLRTMRITGLHRVFTPYRSVAEAVAAQPVSVR